MKLLHVDRDQTFVHGFQNDLLRNGGILCDLENAADMATAREQLAAESFDAVLADPWSFDHDAVGVLQELREAAGDTSIVVLSHVNDDYHAVEAVATGASDFLQKDLGQPEWLLRRVRYTIERGKRTRRRHVAGKAHAARRWRTAVASVLGSSLSQTRQAMYSPSVTDHDTYHDSNPNPPEKEGLSFRVLHVEDDISFKRITAKMLDTAGMMRLGLEHAERLSDALRMLQDEPFDLVMLDLSLPDSVGIETLERMIPVAGDVPVIVITGRDDDASAIQCMRLGAEDFLTKTETNLRFTGRAAQLAITRRRRLTLEQLPDAEAATGLTASAESAVPEVQTREHSRYLLTRPIFAIPILPDGAPADAFCADGFSIDVSVSGVKFELAGVHGLPTDRILLGIEDKENVLHFASVETKRVETSESGMTVAAEFVNEENELLSRRNIEPRFDANACRYRMELPLEVIAKWVEFGILRATLMDRVMICPQCRAVPTFRNGCRICGSVRLHSRPLIHHFACAHIGYVSDFEQEGGIICPKCRTRDLIVGADYEHLSGPYRCLDCDWSDTDLELVGNCLKCDFRFPVNQALEEDLIGYHVHRLDPLALVHGD